MELYIHTPVASSGATLSLFQAQFFDFIFICLFLSAVSPPRVIFCWFHYTPFLNLCPQFFTASHVFLCYIIPSVCSASEEAGCCELTEKLTVFLIQDVTLRASSQYNRSGECSTFCCGLCMWGHRGVRVEYRTLYWQESACGARFSTRHLDLCMYSDVRRPKICSHSVYEWSVTSLNHLNTKVDVHYTWVLSVLSQKTYLVSVRETSPLI